LILAYIFTYILAYTCTCTLTCTCNPQCRQILKSAENSSNPLCLILFAIEGSRLYLEEARLLYKQVLSKTEDSIMAIAAILQRMRTTEDALRVLKQYIGE
jgi:hypothetical protein